MTALSRAETFDRIDELLEAKYRSKDLGNLDDPLAECVYIMISQQTREAVYQRVFRDLRRKYRKWTSLLRAPDADVEQILAPAGLQKQRTAKLKRLLAAVAEMNRQRGLGPASSRTSDLTLDFLRRMKDKEAEALLRSLPGIGPKTARCVMSYALGRKTFAVDTNVHRIFNRMDLIESRGRKLDHDPFQSAVPEALRKRLHINLIHHGRAVCLSGKKPRCGDCVLVSFCKMGRAVVPTQARPATVDLFAGAGGLGSGFRAAGYRLALAIEADRNAAQTYRFNNPGVPVLEARIGDHITAASLRGAVPALRDVRAVLAGPPCQGYSAAGSRNGDDPRNVLYRHVARLARELRAKIVVLEQVPGARRVDGTEYATRISRLLRGSGFAAREYVLRASEFGVPQRRQRLIFVGRRGRQLPPTAPRATHQPRSKTNGNGKATSGKHAGTVQRDLPKTPTLAQVLRVLPRLGSGVAAERWVGRGREIRNLSTMRHSKKVLRKIAAIKPGKGPISYRRLEPSEARTLIAGHRALPVHPSLNRTISVREAALIQGFPIDYVFCGPRAEQPLQVANAVPPPLAAAIAKHLRPIAR